MALINVKKRKNNSNTEIIFSYKLAPENIITSSFFVKNSTKDNEIKQQIKKIIKGLIKRKNIIETKEAMEIDIEA